MASSLSHTLDELNAWGVLEEIQPQLRGFYSFGPGVFQGKQPTPWTGVLIWFKKPGYFEYKTLYMLGIWAYHEVEPIHVAVGTKTLTYAAPILNPEGVYHHLKRGFSTYYQDDGRPPAAAAQFYNAVYDSARRLTMRQEIQDALAHYAGSLSL